MMTPCPVRIRGVTYPSLTAAARALGVPIPTVMRALDKGTLETCGLDHFGGFINGQYFPTKTAAARAQGVTECAFRYAVKTGRTVWISASNLPRPRDPAARRAVVLSNEATPIKLRGVAYPSIRAAARGLGMSSSAVSRALEKGTLEKCGLFSFAGRIDGVLYVSKAAAARALGINKFTLLGQIRKRKIQWVPE